MSEIKLDRRRIVDFIDRRGWYHSWHLPKDTHGAIDWHKPLTKAALLTILERDRRKAIEDLSEAQALIDMVEAMEVEEDEPARA